MHALTIEWGNDLPNKEHHAFLSDIEVGLTCATQTNLQHDVACGTKAHDEWPSART